MRTVCTASYGNAGFRGERCGVTTPKALLLSTEHNCRKRTTSSEISVLSATLPLWCINRHTSSQAERCSTTRTTHNVGCSLGRLPLEPNRPCSFLSAISMHLLPRRSSPVSMLGMPCEGCHAGPGCSMSIPPTRCGHSPRSLFTVLPPRWAGALTLLQH